MKKKLFLSAGIVALGAVLALGGAKVEGVSATGESASRWEICEGSGTVTEVTGGVQFQSSLLNAYGARVGLKDKVKLDGLSFTYSLSGMTSSCGDCRGWYIHNGADSTKYFSETTACCFSFWSIYGQMRGHFGTDHNHNTTATTAVSGSAMDGTCNGMSSENGGHLVMNFYASSEHSFYFEKVSNDYYKMTVYGYDIWGNPNYNATSGSNAYTYIPTSKLALDADGKCYFALFGMPQNASSDNVVTIKNLHNAAYDAETYASSFLTQTSTVCNGAGDKKTGLEAIWSGLSSSYAALYDDSKALLAGATPSEAGSTLEQCAARYDRVVSKYSLTDFMGRVSEVNNSNLGNDASSIILIPASSLVLTLSVAFLVLKKKKEVR